jgi:uncharacterized membrane protein
VAVAALADVLPGPVTAVLYGLVIIGSGLVSRWVAERRRRLTRADQPDSVEREHAQNAAAETFQVALVVMVALGAVLVFQRSFAAAGLTYAGAAVVVLAYWVRYATLRRRY